MIRVEIADVQALVGGGFHVLVDSAVDVTVVGEASPKRRKPSCSVTTMLGRLAASCSVSFSWRSLMRALR